MLKTIINSTAVVIPPPLKCPPPPWEVNDNWWNHAKKQPNYEEPMQQQLSALAKAWYRPNFALFHEMGLGKTFTAINLVAGRYLTKQIDSLVVICPTGVKLVWPMELAKWCPAPFIAHVHVAGGNKDTELFIDSSVAALKVLIVGVEALSQGGAASLLNKFVMRHKPMAVLDESDSIKTHNKIRTKRCIAAGDHIKYKLIMTGTSVTQGIHDLWSQYRFLDPRIIGHKSFFGFRATYCVIGGYQNKEIIGYTNVDQLMARIAPFTDSRSKKEAMPWLPPKIYEQRFVDPTPEQKKVMIDLKDLMVADYKGFTLEISTVLERMTRYQQIVGGHYPHETGEDGKAFYAVEPFEVNPKMGALLEIVHEMGNKKIIIWARFRPEIEAIAKALGPLGEVVQFHGGIKYEDRIKAVNNFQDGPVRFFVSNQMTGGAGITLTAAENVIYYSNTFSYRDRVQSEDRCHRKGTTNKVLYVDITMNHPIDKLIVRALRNKGDMAQYVKDELAKLQNIETLEPISGT